MGKSRKRASMLAEKILLFTFPIWFFGGISLYFGVLSRPREYKFGQSTDQIQTIEIVEILDGHYGNNTATQQICVVEQNMWPTFWYDFGRVECRKYVNDPCECMGDSGLRITYADSSYELITEGACYYYSAQKEYDKDYNWFYFDQDQFELFILKYTGEAGGLK